MTPAEAVASIKAAFEEHDADLDLALEAIKRARRSGRRVHNKTAKGLAEHGEKLGLSPDEIVLYGGGIGKDPDEDEE